MDLALALIRISVPLAVMAWAAVCDVRTREVPDACWLAVCLWGVAMTAASCPSEGVAAVTAAAGSLLLTAYMLSPGLVGRRGAAVFLAAIACFSAGFAANPWHPLATAGLVVPVLFLLYYGLHLSGLVAGGADVKCLMSLAIAFPAYPVSDAIPALWIPTYPESLVLSPSVSVLVLALVLALAWGVRTAATNIRRGESGPGMFHVLRMPVDEARGSFVWPVERAVDGAVVRTGACPVEEKDAVLDGLEALGRRDVAVTPMIPFVLPLAAAAWAVLLLGSPLFALVA